MDSPVQLDMNTDYPEVKKEILDLLKNLSEKSKKEVCGYISSSGVFYEKENVHPDPENFFLIDPKECMWEDDIIIFHSHPDKITHEGFSEWDIENQFYFQLDMLLYSVNNKKFYYKKND